jgi:hypothetical protein
MVLIRQKQTVYGLPVYSTTNPQISFVFFSGARNADL